MLISQKMRLTGCLHQMCISFSGCGFLVPYQIGAVKCLLKHGGELLKSIDKFGGTSAGSLVATVLAIDPSKIDFMLKAIYDLADDVRRKPLRSFTPGFSVTSAVKKYLQNNLPDNAHQLVNKKLFISVTNLSSMKNSVYAEFHSKDDLINCLLCSCFIPVYDRVALPKFRNMYCIDGSYTGNLYRFPNSRTVVVTPFSGEVDISPIDADCKKIQFRQQKFCVNTDNVIRLKRAILPAPKSTLDELLTNGYDDATRFLNKEGFYKSDVSFKQTM